MSTGFQSYDDLINQVTTNGQVTDGQFAKVTSAMQGNQWHRTYIANGIPGAGTEPAATPGAAYSADASSITFPAVSPKNRFVMSFGAVSGNSPNDGILLLYDRLVGVGAVSITTTGNKTINSAALTRYTTGVDVQCWLEVTTATTTTAAVVNLSQYTNDTGATGHSGASITFPAAATVKDCALGPLPLQAGDLGVRSVQVGLNVGTAAAAGVVNVVLIRPLVYLPLAFAIWNEADSIMDIPAFPQVFDNASLNVYFLSQGTTATSLWANVVTGYE